MDLLNNLLKSGQGVVQGAENAVGNFIHPTPPPTSPVPTPMPQAQTQPPMSLANQVGQILGGFGQTVRNDVVGGLHAIGQGEINLEHNVPFLGQLNTGIRSTVAPILSQVPGVNALINPQNTQKLDQMGVNNNLPGFGNAVTRFVGSQLPYVPLMMATDAVVNPFTSKAAAMVPEGSSLLGAAASGAAKGAIRFAPFGWMGALEPAQSPQDRVHNIAISTLQNIAMGASLGAVGGASGYAFNAVKNKLLGVLTDKYNMNPQQAETAVGQFARDELGRFTSQVKNFSIPKIELAPVKAPTDLASKTRANIKVQLGKPGNEPIFYGDLREAVGLPRSGNYQEGKLSWGNSEEQAAPANKGLTPEEMQKYGKDLKTPQGQQEMVTEYQKALQNKQPLDQLLGSVAQETGAEPISGLKNPATAVKKVIEKRSEGRAYEPEDLNDLTRGRLVYPDKGTLYQGKDMFIQKAKQMGLTIAKESDFFKHPNDGYQGYHVDLIFPNGQHEEVQFHTQKSLAASLATHTFHEKYGDGELPEAVDKVKSKINHEIMDSTNPQAKVVADSIMQQNAPMQEEAQQNALQVATSQPSLKDEIMAPPPRARMSQKAIEEGATAPRTGADISVMPQASKRFPTEFDAVTGKKIPNNPSEPQPGVAALNPKNVADQARLAAFAERQNFQVRAGNLAQEMDSILKTPQDNIRFRLAVENPEKLEQYASKATNPQAFTQLAQKVSDFYDYALTAAQGQKVDLGEVKNYFTHIWDLNKPGAREIYEDLMAKNAKNFTSGFTRERVVNTISEGLNAGLQLKNEKASADIVQYAKSLSRQVENNAFNNKINELRPGGAVPFAEHGTVPYNYEGRLFQQSNRPGNQGTFIDPEIQKYMGFYNKSVLADNPLIAGKDVNLFGKEFHMPGVDQVNTGIKELKLAGGLFHALRESINYTGQQLLSGHVPDLAGGARSFIDPSFAREQIANFIKDGTVDTASKMGVDISSAGGIGDEKADVFSMMQSKDQIKKATFQRLIPYYILKTIQNLPEEARTPEVGKQIMALYNGLNSEVAGTNRTVGQLARLGFLAPQFNLGKVINVMSALKPVNTPAANFARQALIGTAVATLIEYQIANTLVNRKIDTNAMSNLQNGILRPSIPLPYKSPTGKNLDADLPASNLADLYKTGVGSLLQAGIHGLQGNKDQAMNDLGQAGTDLSHTLTSRTGSVLSLLNQVQSGKDYYGNPVTLSGLAQSQLPIPVVQLLKTIQPNPKTGVPAQDWQTALLNTVGARVHTDPNDPSVRFAQATQKIRDNLQGKDQQAWDYIQKLGNDPQSRMLKDAILQKQPNVFLAEQQRAIQQANGDMSKVDPLYTSPYAQQYLKYEQLYNDAPGSAEEKQYLKNNPGITQLMQQRQQYYAANPINNPTAGQALAAPQASPYVMQQLAANNYKDPQVQQYLQQHLLYTNTLRQQQGLDPVDQYGNILGSKNYGKTFSTGGSGGMPGFIRRGIMRENRFQEKGAETKIQGLLKSALAKPKSFRAPHLALGGLKVPRISLKARKGRSRSRLRLA